MRHNCGAFLKIALAVPKRVERQAEQDTRLRLAAGGAGTGNETGVSPIIV